jgi:putative hemolysin
MKIRFVTIALTGLLGLVACSQPDKKPAETAQKTAAAQKKYYCTMHPNIGSDKPGTCSKCGMDLVERDTTKK